MTSPADQRPAGEQAEPATVADREERWQLSVRLAIEAASQTEARAVADQALSRLDPELPMLAEPVLSPLRLRDGIWVATTQPDLSTLSAIDPDDAGNRCRYVSSHFPAGVSWTTREAPGQARWDWPPDIWSRRPGQDDVLLHPAVQAVMIWCEER